MFIDIIKVFILSLVEAAYRVYTCQQHRTYDHCGSIFAIVEK